MLDRSLFFEIHRQFNIERRALDPQRRIVFDDFSALALLKISAPLSVGAIAKEQLIWPSTMSRRVSRLVEIGLVSLEQSHLDRRVNLGALTPYGNELTVELCQAFLDNLIPGSSLDRLGLELADVVSIVARMGRVPMSASGLIAFCYGMRACPSMRVADIVNLTGLQQATVSMTLRSMEEQAMMGPILFGGARGDRPHCKGGLRYITQCGQAYADELLRMTDAL